MDRHLLIRTLHVREATTIIKYEVHLSWLTTGQFIVATSNVYSNIYLRVIAYYIPIHREYTLAQRFGGKNVFFCLLFSLTFTGETNFSLNIYSYCIYDS